MAKKRRAMNMGTGQHAPNPPTSTGETVALLDSIKSEEKEELKVFMEQFEKVRKGEISQEEFERLYNMSTQHALERVKSRNESILTVFQRLSNDSGELTEFARGLISLNEEEKAHVQRAEFLAEQAKNELESATNAIPTLQKNIATAKSYRPSFVERIQVWRNFPQEKLATAQAAYDAALTREGILKVELEEATMGIGVAKSEAENMRTARLNSTDLDDKAELVNEAYTAIINKLGENINTAEEKKELLITQNNSNMDNKLVTAKEMEELEAERNDIQAVLKTEQAKLEAEGKKSKMSSTYIEQQRKVANLETNYRLASQERKEAAMKFQTYEKYEAYFNGMVMSEEQTISDLRAYKETFTIARDNRMVGVCSWVSQQQSASTLQTTQDFASVGNKLDEMMAESSLEIGAASRKASVEEMSRHDDRMVRQDEQILKFIQVMEARSKEEEEIIERMKKRAYVASGEDKKEDITVQPKKENERRRRV